MAGAGARRTRGRRPPPARSASRAAVLLLALVAVAACIDPNPRTVRHREVATASAAEAEPALRRYGCTGCHVVPGIRGARGLVGPPLTGFAERRYIAGRVPNETEYLVQFLVDPQTIKPGSAMPATGIGAAEARHVAAYLYTLR